MSLEPSEPSSSAVTALHRGGSRLNHAVQCAGWSDHCPAAAEGRDWEAEALRLAGKVGVI